jgi:ATP-dependent Lon protease
LPVGDRYQVEAIKRAIESHSGIVGLVLAKEPDAPDDPSNLYKAEVAGKILKLIHADDDSAKFLIHIIEPFTIEELTEAADGYFARVRNN